MKRNGFTLVEILIVLSILAVFSSFALSGFSGFSARLFLDSSAKSLASDLRALQSRAVLQHCTQNLALDDLNFPPGIHLASGKEIQFSPSGFPPPGGSGSLILQNRFGQTRRIIVSSVGRVRIE